MTDFHHTRSGILKQNEHRLGPMVERDGPYALRDEQLFTSCLKFFEKREWDFLEAVTFNRYTGFCSEDGMDMSYSAYARYLLSAFKESLSPTWTMEDEAAAQPRSDEMNVALAYCIWGVDEYAEAIEPVEGSLRVKVTFENKEIEFRTLPRPFYPGIEAHASSGLLGPKKAQLPIRDATQVLAHRNDLGHEYNLRSIWNRSPST